MGRYRPVFLFERIIMYKICLFIVFIFTMNVACYSTNYKKSNYVIVSKAVALRNDVSRIDPMYIAKFKANDNYIIAVSWIKKSVYLWDISGNFIGIIGAEGKGPGEHVFPIEAFFIGENEIGVVDSARRLINKYHVKNNKVSFTDTIDFFQSLKFAPLTVAQYNQDHFVLFYGNMSKDFPKIITVDSNFNILKRIMLFSDKEDVGSIDGAGHTDRYIYSADIIKYKTANKAETERVSSKIFVFDYNGKLLHKKIKTNDRGKILLFHDISGEYLLCLSHNGGAYKNISTRNENPIEIFEIKSGKKIGEYSFPEIIRNDPSCRVFFQNGKIYSLYPEDEGKNIKLDIYTVKIDKK